MANILIIDGHPDSNSARLCHALTQAYEEGATAAGYMVELCRLADQPVSFMRSKSEFEDGDVPDYAKVGQEAILRADHIVLVFPLWLGTMPAMLKAWMEQTFRYGFAMEVHERGFKRLLKGKSARVIVTMGMPAFFYRLYFFAHGTGVLKRSIFGFAGIGPIRQTLIGGVDQLGDAGVRKWCKKLRTYGATAT